MYLRAEAGLLEVLFTEEGLILLLFLHRSTSSRTSVITAFTKPLKRQTFALKQRAAVCEDT